MQDNKSIAATKAFLSTENSVGVNFKRYVACLHARMIQTSKPIDSSTQNQPARQLELPHQKLDRVEQLMSRYAFSKH
jgi:hypothetical protein